MPLHTVMGGRISQTAESMQRVLVVSTFWGTAHRTLSTPAVNPTRALWRVASPARCPGRPEAQRGGDELECEFRHLR